MPANVSFQNIKDVIRLILKFTQGKNVVQTATLILSEVNQEALMTSSGQQQYNRIQSTVDKNIHFFLKS